MNNEEFEKMMKDLPGAKKAHQGFIIEGDGYSFHVQGILSQKDIEGLTNSETFFYHFALKKRFYDYEKLKMHTITF